MHPSVVRQVPLLFSKGQHWLLALCTLAVFGQSTVVQAQRVEPTARPREIVRPRTPTRTVESIEPKTETLYEKVQISRDLEVSIRREINGSEFVGGGYQASVKAAVLRRFEALRQEPFDSAQLRIVSLVDDTDTDNSLKAPVFAGKVEGMSGSDATAFSRFFARHRNGVLLMIGHVEPELGTFAGQSFALLEGLAKSNDVSILFLGCRTARYASSGTVDYVNSVDVVHNLSLALQSPTIGGFLEALSGPQIQLSLEWSLVAAMSDRLALDGIDKAQVRRLSVVVLGFQSLKSSLPTPPTLARISMATRVPYDFVTFAAGLCLSIAMTLVFQLGAGRFENGNILRQPALRLIVGLGEVTLFLSAGVGGLAVFLIVLFVLGTWFQVLFEEALELPKRAPSALKVGAGLLSTWSIGGFLVWFIGGFA